MLVLGIMWELNSTVALVKDGNVLSCVSEERFSRIKNDERYPKNAIEWILKTHNISANEIDKYIFASEKWGPGYILIRHGTNFSVKDRVQEQFDIWKPRLLEGRNVSHLEIYKNRIDFDQYPGKAFWRDIITNKLKGDNAHVSSAKSAALGQSIRKKVLIEHLGIEEEKIYFTDHPHSHAAYAYYSMPIEERSGSRFRPS